MSEGTVVPRTRWRSWARWGWLLTTLGLGTAVIASAWTSYRSARTATDDLIRGEAHTLRDAILLANRPGHEPIANLDSLVAAQQEGGLRYAAWVRLDGRVVASGGTPAPAPLEVPASRDPTFTQLGSRIRVYFPPPLPPGASAADPRRPPTIVMEFEPVVARDLTARAFRSLLIGGDRKSVV